MATQGEGTTAGHPAWQSALAFTAVAGTMATDCMMPSVALAVMSAATMSKRRATVTVAGAWATSQLLGFALLGLPFTAYAIAWGAALGGASLAAMLVARALLSSRGYGAATMLAAFALAFVTYEGALFAFALLAGGLETFTPAIIARILRNDALWFAALAGLHAVLTRAAPKTFGPRLSLRLA